MNEQTTNQNTNNEISVPVPQAKAATQGWVLDETITDANKGTYEYLKTKGRKISRTLIGIALIWDIILIWVIINIFRSFILPRDIFLALLPWVGKLTYNVIIHGRVMREFMQQFALANGMSYQEHGDASNFHGALFDLGHRRVVDNLVSGTWNGNAINLFDYHYTVGSGKNQTTYYCTACQIDYPSILPPILLIADNQHFDFGGIAPPLSDWTKIKPEGDFDKTFDLYSKKEFEIEALEIFSPDFMEKMLADWPRFNLEFHDNSLCVFCNHVISTKAELEQMHDLAEYLIAKIEPLAERMESSVKALEALQNNKQ